MRELIIKLTDDMDRVSEANETCIFTLNGQEGELDLTTIHADELRAVMEPYFRASRTAKEKTKKPKVRSGISTRMYNMAMREWCAQQEIELKKRKAGGWLYPDDVCKRFQQDLDNSTCDLQDLLSAAARRDQAQKNVA